MLALAQNRVVTGKVIDDAGNPVAFATILVKGSNVGVKADENGNFTVNNVKADAVLVISAAGFGNKDFSTSGKDFVTASLARSTSTGLQEVIVTTALGQVRQKGSLGTSTATIKSSELVQGRATNLQNGLTGKVSGLNVLTTNNGVFADTRITLRGIRSLTGNNQPMLILDGIPLSLGYLSSINPNDIADVTILKSSSATGIYGPDGVNGAIVVTTKRGSKLKPQITVSHSTQWESISYMPKFQKRWGSGYSQDADTGEGIYEAHEQQSWGDEFDGSIRRVGDPDPNGDTLTRKYSYVENGRKSFFNTGITNQTDVSFSTGDFYLSAQNVNIKGVMPDDENNRRSLTFRSEKEYNKFKAIFNVRYTNQKYNVTTNNTNIYYDVTGAPGQYNLSDFKDWRNDYFSSPDGYYTTYLSNRGKTPYFAKDNNRQRGRTDDVFGNVELNYKFNSWLNVVYRVGATVTSGQATSTINAFQNSAFFFTRPDAQDDRISAAISDASTYSSRVTSEAFVNFNKKFGDLGISATVGHSFRESRVKNVTAGSNNLGTSTFLSIATRLGEPTVDVENSLARLQRFFGRVGFDYKGWAFVEGTASYDKDTRLVPANKIFENKDISFFYPGVSASLLLHQVIPGFKDNKIINYLKLRGAISKTGNINVAPYANETVFGSGLFFPFGSTPGYQIGTTTYQSGGLKPEYVNNKEVGIELGFLNNRINLEATYYSQNNTDQVLGIQLSNTTGFTTSFLNAGNFTNKGLEIDLKLTPLVKIGDVNIDFKINYSNQTNKITKLVEGVNELGIGNYNYAIVGQSAFVFKLTDYERDDQGRVIVGADGMPTVASGLTQFGKTSPDHILGLNLNLNWKGLSFSVTGEYRTGNQIVADQLGQFLDDNGISERSGQNGRQAFIFPNSVIDDGSGKYVTNTSTYTQQYGRLFWNSDIYNTSAISNYVASGAFWKIREASLTYTLPSKLFKGNTLKGVTVGVTGRNLFMFLPKSNPWTDPEFTANGNAAYTGNAIGRSTAYNLPPTRIFGANVTFQF